MSQDSSHETPHSETLGSGTAVPSPEHSPAASLSSAQPLTRRERDLLEAETEAGFVVLGYRTGLEGGIAGNFARPGRWVQEPWGNTWYPEDGLDMVRKDCFGAVQVDPQSHQDQSAVADPERVDGPSEPTADQSSSHRPLPETGQEDVVVVLVEWVEWAVRKLVALSEQVEQSARLELQENQKPQVAPVSLELSAEADSVKRLGQDSNWAPELGCK